MAYSTKKMTDRMIKALQKKLSKTPSNQTNQKNHIKRQISKLRTEERTRESEKAHAKPPKKPAAAKKPAAKKANPAKAFAERAKARVSGARASAKKAVGTVGKKVVGTVQRIQKAVANAKSETPQAKRHAKDERAASVKAAREKAWPGGLKAQRTGAHREGQSKLPAAEDAIRARKKSESRPVAKKKSTAKKANPAKAFAKRVKARASEAKASAKASARRAVVKGGTKVVGTVKKIQAMVAKKKKEAKRQRGGFPAHTLSDRGYGRTQMSDADVRNTMAANDARAKKRAWLKTDLGKKWLADEEKASGKKPAGKKPAGDRPFIPPLPKAEKKKKPAKTSSLHKQLTRNSWKS